MYDLICIVGIGDSILLSRLWMMNDAFLVGAVALRSAHGRFGYIHTYLIVYPGQNPLSPQHREISRRN